jgi:hypothetical protein
MVREEYRGLLRYWPSIVIVESSPLCGMVMRVGEDYLVSGWRAGYGTIEVNECTRTQPFDSAQVDLRTLDGSPVQAELC